MKKILMSAVVMIFAVGALSAQSPWFLSGSVGVNSSKFGDAKATAFTIRPQVGYMFNENFGIALDLGYDMGTTNVVDDEISDDDFKANAFGAGLSGLYSLQIVDKFYFTPSLRVGFAANQQWLDVDDAVKAKSTDITVDLDILKFEFRPSMHWGFTFGFGGISFGSNKVKDADDATTNFGLNIGQNASVGFKYYF